MGFETEIPNKSLIRPLVDTSIETAALEEERLFIIMSVAMCQQINVASTYSRIVYEDCQYGARVVPQRRQCCCCGM